MIPAVFGSGAEAVKNAAAFAPQLLLLDVMMPGMDGPATLAELRKLPQLAQTVRNAYDKRGV